MKKENELKRVRKENLIKWDGVVEAGRNYEGAIQWVDLIARKEHAERGMDSLTIFVRGNLLAFLLWYATQQRVSEGKKSLVYARHFWRVWNPLPCKVGVTWNISWNDSTKNLIMSQTWPLQHLRMPEGKEILTIFACKSWFYVQWIVNFWSAWKESLHVKASSFFSSFFPVRHRCLEARC